jgi:hypothetical protein
MKRLAFALALLASPALAQQPEQPPLDAQTYVANLRNQRDQATVRAGNLDAELPAIIAAYEARLTEALRWVGIAQKDAANMDAYLKACGDRAGCTVPAQETP